MDKIGCKILGDLCQPGRNDTCAEICTSKDQEHTDKEYISKASYPKFLQKLSSHSWGTHRKIICEVYLCVHEGKKKRKPFWLNTNLQKPVYEHKPAKHLPSYSH